MGTMRSTRSAAEPPTDHARPPHGRQHVSWIDHCTCGAACCWFAWALGPAEVARDATRHPCAHSNPTCVCVAVRLNGDGYPLRFANGYCSHDQVGEETETEEEQAAGRQHRRRVRGVAAPTTHAHHRR